MTAGPENGLSYGELGTRLIEEIPELEDAYRKLLDWWGEDTPGPHIVYGDVLTPYIVRMLESGDDPAAIRKAFGLVEALIADEDVKVQEVAVVTVLEQLQDNQVWLRLMRPHLGPLAKQAVRDLAQFWRGESLDW